MIQSYLTVLFVLFPDRCLGNNIFHRKSNETAVLRKISFSADSNDFMLNECSGQTLANCLCEPQSLINKNFLEIVCSGNQIEPILREFNQISDRLYLSVVENGLTDIFTIVLRLNNYYSMDKHISAIMDCETSIPLAKLSLDEEIPLISIPLGRRACKDPLMKLCAEYSQGGPCRCVTERYIPPVITFLCQGLDINNILYHLKVIRTAFWKKSNLCSDKGCTLDMMKIIMRDIGVSNMPYNFIICETNQTLLFAPGLSNELIINSHLRLDLCIKKDHSLDDICSKYNRSQVCRCVGKDIMDSNSFIYQCYGGSKSDILKNINSIHKNYQRVGSWNLKFANLKLNFILRDHKYPLQPIGFCDNLTTINYHVSSAGQPILSTILSGKLCLRDLLGFCRLAQYHHPCRCHPKELKSKVLLIRCINGNVKAIVDDLNYIQRELRKIIGFEKEKIIQKVLLENVSRHAIVLRDCEKLTIIPQRPITSKLIEYAIEYGTNICLGSTAFVCEGLKYSIPCRCGELKAKSDTISITCVGNDFRSILLSRNAISVDVRKLAVVSKESIRYLNFILENAFFVPALYDCEKRIRISRESFTVFNATTKIGIKLCNDRMLEEQELQRKVLKNKKMLPTASTRSSLRYLKFNGGNRMKRSISNDRTFPVATLSVPPTKGNSFPFVINVFVSTYIIIFFILTLTAFLYKIKRNN